MDVDLTHWLERAVVTLGLDRPLHPWWLGEARSPRPVRRSPILVPACPMPYDVDPDLLLAAFAEEDRVAVDEQIEDSYRNLAVLPFACEDDHADDDVVHVELGLPLVATDRVLLRICTRNVYGETPSIVTGEHHAWLDREATSLPVVTAEQQKLAAVWQPWVVGRSPGLRALVDLNACSESELLRLPHMNESRARAILAARPFADVDELAAVEGVGATGLERLRLLVTT